MPEKSRVSIIPYLEIEGVRTFTDSFIKDIYKDVSSIIIDGSIKTSDEFLSLMKNPGQNLFYVTYYDNDIAGVFWLNRPQSKWCQFNFYFYKGYRGELAKYIGRKVLRQMIQMEAFDAFLGVIPAKNKPAINYSLSLGWREIGLFKNGIWNEKAGKSEDAILLSFDRGCLKNENI